MVFISLNMTLENFLKIDTNIRMSEIDWLLFDRFIKDRRLTSRNDFSGNGNYGNLYSYINRTLFYPLYYKEPIHMYFMKEKVFQDIPFFPKTEEYDRIGSLINMKRVPRTWKEEKYPMIPEEEMIFGNGTYEENIRILKEAFKKLALCKDEIAHICIGEKL